MWCESDVPCTHDTFFRFDLYERYQTLSTDDDNFQQFYLELVYKPKYQIWCESDVPCAQDDDNFWQCYLELVYKPKYQMWCESDVPCAQDPSLPN